MRPTVCVSSPMSCARRSSSVMSSTAAVWRSALRWIERTDATIRAIASASVAVNASERRPDFSASARAVIRLAAIRLIAADCSCEAPAASSAPVAICSIERPSSLVAADDSTRPLASSSVAAATRSNTVCGFAARPRAAGGFPVLVVGGSGVASGCEAEAAIFDFFTNAIGPRRDQESDGTGCSHGSRRHRKTMVPN